MADINSLIRRVRSRVHDSMGIDAPVEGRPLYPDGYYEDAIASGLGRINLDLDSSYTVTTLPVKYEYLMELRGTINMCYVRGAEGAAGDVEDFPNVPDQIVTVPQLTVQRQQMPLEGPKYWLKLADKLEQEYNNSFARLESRGEEGAEIQQYVMMRRSLRTGRRMSYDYDKPIKPPEDFAVGIVGGIVQGSWSVVYDEYLDYIQILRSSSADFSTSSVVITLSDNHDNTFTDSPSAGTWYYKAVLRNSNDLTSETLAASVVVV